MPYNYTITEFLRNDTENLNIHSCKFVFHYLRVNNLIQLLRCMILAILKEIFIGL